jgi:hypothetical protein
MKGGYVKHTVEGAHKEELEETVKKLADLIL